MDKITVELTKVAGGWMATSPQLPGANTQGEDVPDALEMMADAIRMLKPEGI